MSPSIGRWAPRIALGLVALMLAGYAVGSLGGEGDARGTLRRATADGGGSAEPGAGEPASGVAASRAGISASEDALLDAVAPAEQVGGPSFVDRVVRTGDLNVTVADEEFESAWRRAFRIADDLGGSVLSSSRGRTDPEAREAARMADEGSFGDITLRVPSGQFEVAMERLRGLGEVRGEVVSSQDVTEEFVDLESRLRNLEAQQSVLLRLMARAESIEDTLAVQRELARVQSEIERIRGRLDFLRERTEFARVSLHLATPGAAVSSLEEEGPSFAKAWETALEGLERMAAAAMIGAMWLAPFALLAAGVLGVRRWRTPPAAPPAAPRA